MDNESKRQTYEQCSLRAMWSEVDVAPPGGRNCCFDSTQTGTHTHTHTVTPSPAQQTQLTAVKCRASNLVQSKQFEGANGQKGGGLLGWEGLYDT